jgi:hypothetical protein
MQNPPQRFTSCIRGHSSCFWGAMAAFIPTSSMERFGRFGELMSTAGLGLIAFACVCFTRQTPFPGKHALVPCIGAVLLLLATWEIARYELIVLFRQPPFGRGWRRPTRARIPCRFFGNQSLTMLLTLQSSSLPIHGRSSHHCTWPTRRIMNARRWRWFVIQTRFGRKLHFPPCRIQHILYIGCQFDVFPA